MVPVNAALAVAVLITITRKVHNTHINTHTPFILLLETQVAQILHPINQNSKCTWERQANPPWVLHTSQNVAVKT